MEHEYKAGDSAIVNGRSLIISAVLTDHLVLFTGKYRMVVHKSRCRPAPKLPAIQMPKSAYRATREIELEFPDPKYGNRYLTIPAGQTITGEAQQDFLYMEIQGFGPARIPLALLEEVK